MGNTEKELMVCGASGTGKSAFISYCMKYLQANKEICKLIGGETDYKIYYTASTNKASAVLSSMLGNIEVTTIHKLLALRPEDNYDTGVPKLIRTKNTSLIRGAIIVIDEFSMIDSQLLKIIREQTINCKILWIGDHLQLAPVYESKIPAYASCDNKVILTEVMRNTGEITRISKLWSKAVNGADYPKIVDNDNVSILPKEDYVKKLHEIYGNRENARALTWTNKAAQQYNHYIQDTILDADMYQGGTYMVVNNAYIHNGTYFPADSIVRVHSVEDEIEYSLEEFGCDDIFIGRTIGIGKPESFSYHLVATDHEQLAGISRKAAREKNWRLYFYIKKEILDLRQSFASTINKAQGSTFDNVFVDMGDIQKCHQSNQYARMMYVAMSRASKHVYVLG